MLEILTHNTAETEAAARQIAKQLHKGDVLAFRGGMGAGKTAFVRGLCSGLGIPDEVSSPTFAIVNEYWGDPPLYHFDMYRIQSEDDLYTTGFYDYLDSGESILAVEWSENIAEFLPETAITISIEILSQTDRRIQVIGGGRF